MSRGDGGAASSTPDGTWLWGRLMEWCKQRRVAPADYNDLFAIVADARSVTAGDSSRLDFMQANRVALTPEYEGPWDAEVYGEEGTVQTRHSGLTPRDALDAAMSYARGDS